ncbi:unnamed protein product [Dracunculus medinensis]|uniref:Prolyl endopeptidase n=1 Tax=Dracunculus medinensis TaxID=318479 RepID=A0A0N4UCJ4_DRAME|nr:unnamed protein product [Dracunculus medinensis]
MVFDSLDCKCYPLARKDDTIVEDFHGIKANPDSAETKEFVNRVNSISERFFKGSSIREKIRKRLTQLWNYEKYYCPSKRGKYYYYYYNTGLLNQNVLYQQNNINEKGHVFLDPNKFSDDGTVSIRIQCFSKDGSILAFGLSEKGSDWVTLRFRTAEGVDVKDVVKGVKYSGLAWMPDNSGVFYSAYPDYKGALEGCAVEKNEYQSLFFHKMGTAQEDDVLIADFRSDPRCDPTNMLYYYDLSTLENNEIKGKLDLLPLFDKADAKYEFIGNDGDYAFVLTNHSSPMYKLIRTKFSTVQVGLTWETIIKEKEKCKLDWVKFAGKDRLIVAYLEDVKTKLYVYCPNTGERLCQIPLDIGTISGVFCTISVNELFLLFESFFTPGIIYHCDFQGLELSEPLKLKEIRRIKLSDVDTNEFFVKQVFASNRDGTKVPMYIMHNSSIKLDGNAPTILNGYGGFNRSILPNFSISRLLFLEHFNGIIAQANLRGGDEYGEKWHEAGMLERKQNVFDDFIASAEYLINNKYTSSERLAIRGASNGGLLVAACSQQRPDLFGAVVIEVGVLDMLRFHKFGIGGAWIPEYGDPDNPSHFCFLYKYSPLHNIRMPQANQWPSTLLMTADHDDRVVPSHSLKYIARLYEEILKHGDTQTNPVLIRVEVKAGHGSGKPTSKLIAHLVDMFSFLQRVLGLTWKDK